MTALLITPEKEAEIRQAVARARANVIPWEVLRETAVATVTATLLLSERRPGTERRPESIAVVFAGGVVAAISFEEQPLGLIRHMSCGTGRPGKDRLLNPAMIGELCRLFGFHGFPPRPGRVWIEEYKPDHFAVNVAELEHQREAGHA